MVRSDRAMKEAGKMGIMLVCRKRKKRTPIFKMCNPRVVFEEKLPTSLPALNRDYLRIGRDASPITQECGCLQVQAHSIHSVMGPLS